MDTQMEMASLRRQGVVRIKTVLSHLPEPVYTRIHGAYRFIMKRFSRTWPPVPAYAEALAAALPVVENTVLYESFHGKSLNCSPLAIFQTLLRDPNYAHLTHIWAVNALSVVPDDLVSRPNVRFVVRGTAEYGTALATAGIVISNTTLPTFFQRRSGQIYANTWHGVPLKTMFRYEGGTITAHANSQRNFLQASHLLMPNNYTADALLQSADVHEAVADKMACIGAPRIDETLGADRSALRKELGLPSGCEVIFVAPTWRGTPRQAEVEMPTIDALLDRLGQLDANRFAVFVQLHDFVEKHTSGARRIPAGLSTNRFMAAVDILITDYSSIMFDFFATGRKVILFAYDLDEYTRTRGLTVGIDTLPAPLCTEIDEVLAEVMRNDRSADDPRYASAQALFFPCDDGQSSRRAIDAIFAPRAATSPKNIMRRPRILIFGGAWKTNGITSSILNLLSLLAGYEADIYVVTAGGIIDRTPELAANIHKIPPGVHLLHRTGGMVVEATERADLEQVYKDKGFRDAAHESRIRALFARESRRLFGAMEFDVAIDFSGYARYWSMVIGATAARRHVCYQHNDMLAEAKTRFDILYGVFVTLKWYDASVSVSNEIRRVNLANLAQYYTGPDQALTVRNLIDPAAIRAGGREALPKHLERTEGRIRFVTVGRMSPEKAQTRMIIALAELIKEGHDVELVIIGTGPLRRMLTKYAAKQGVKHRVNFVGQLDNPFALMTRCDCFVLSSDYEGQPMVLLEALCLGLPIVATDIPGARSVLGADLGLLVPVSAEGIAEGMRRCITGDLSARPFDAEAYCQTVMQEFMDRTLQMQLDPITPSSPQSCMSSRAENRCNRPSCY